MAKQELLVALRERYRSASKKDKSRILDEFIAITGHHRKHGIRLLGQFDEDDDVPRQARGQRIYDEAVREGVVIIWVAADRICGKRLKAAMPHLVESMERHGHLALDPEVRDRLLVASAATLDRLLKPIRPTAGSRRRRRRKRSMGKRVPVRTYNDWNGPPPGFLEIDLVVHSGGPLSGSFIHSLVATDVCTGWTEAVPLLAKEQSLIVEGLEAIGQRLPFPIRGIDSDNDGAFINETLIGYCAALDIPSQCPDPAFQPLPPDLRLGQVLCFKHQRRVARDNTVKFQRHILQLLPGGQRHSYAGATVLVLHSLDGRLSLQHEGRIIASQTAPASPGSLRNGIRPSPGDTVPYTEHEEGAKPREGLPGPRAMVAAGDGPRSDDDDDEDLISIRVVASPNRPTFLQQARWDAIQKAKLQGLSIRRMAKDLGLHRDTVRKYIDAESPPTRRSPTTSLASQSDPIAE